ncbi:MAG: hypothetical protein HY566_01495 [Candidatus Kerfeldbacteria bacterium]|nr:hypothetical protein [Candidatus Kerfeldbacteria bacterium]
MTLYCDPTADGSMLLALKDGKRLVGIHRLMLRRGDHENVLPRMLRFLKSMASEISDIREIVVVRGPGRFSSLRVMAVIANMLAWSYGCRLFAVKRPSIVTDDARYLTVLDHAKLRVRRVVPLYGRPPSITAPLKRQAGTFKDVG